MQVKKETISNLHESLLVTIEVDDYKKEFDSTIKKYSKEMQIPGFRPGKVPKSLIKNRFGLGILAEQLNEILAKSVDGYIRENEIDLIGYPIPEANQEPDLEINNLKSYDFKYEIGLAPDFKISLIEDAPEFPKRVVEVEDDMIEKEIDSHRKRYGESVEADSVSEEDAIIHLQLSETDGEGNVIEEGHQSKAYMTANLVVDRKLPDEIMGKKVGETVDLNVWEVFDRSEEEIAKHILSLELAEAKEKNPIFKAEVLEVKVVESAELNEKLFTQIFGEECTTEEQYRENIKKEIAAYYDRESDKTLVKLLREALLERTAFELPEGFIRKWLSKIKEEQKVDESAEDQEESFNKFKDELRWSLILRKIGKDFELKVEEEEVKKYTGDFLMQMMQQYRLYHLGESEVQSLYQRYLSDENFISQANETILEGKVFDLVKEKIQIKEQKMSLEEFSKEN